MRDFLVPSRLNKEGFTRFLSLETYKQILMVWI